MPAKKKTSEDKEVKKKKTASSKKTNKEAKPKKKVASKKPSTKKTRSSSKTTKKKTTKKTATKKATKTRKKSTEKKVDKAQAEKIQSTIEALPSLLEPTFKEEEHYDPYAQNKQRLQMDFDHIEEAKRNRTLLGVISFFVILLLGLWYYNFKMVIMKETQDSPGLGELTTKSFEEAREDIAQIEPTPPPEAPTQELQNAKEDIQAAIGNIISAATVSSTTHSTSTISTSTLPNQ